MHGYARKAAGEHTRMIQEIADLARDWQSSDEPPEVRKCGEKLFAYLQGRLQLSEAPAPTADAGGGE
jgi:hypothetical protein